jgi:hypothetical protein
MDRFLNPKKRPSEAEQGEEDGAKTAKIEKVQDRDGKVVDYILGKAQYGHNGKFSTNASKRKILLIGKPYYWTNDSIPIEDLPDYFVEFLKAYQVEECNSILCNVYLEKGSKIAWHRDLTPVLQPGKGMVHSISLAVHAQDRDKELATMRFKMNNNVTTHSLRHGTCITFDAFADYTNNRFHEVPSTKLPRVNITCRHMR